MFPRLLLVYVILLWTAGFSFAQESEPSPPPQFEILRLNGGKQSPGANGEGITSYKTDYEYQKRGQASVRLIKKSELKFKFELPVGYTVFNDLIYLVESDEMYLVWSDITFNL